MLGKSTGHAQLIVAACCMASGMVNFWMLELMSAAMQRGPNGIVWAIIQSATIIPFIMGFLFFGVSFNVVKGCGIVLVIIALTLFGLSKDNSGATSNTWLLLAFSAFFVCGIQQTVSNIPSYSEDTRQVISVFKSMMGSIGTLISALICNAIRRIPIPRLFMENCRRGIFWKYIILSEGIGLFVSYFLYYNGMDALGRAGLGNVANPLMVVSCIVGFVIYSVLFLRERLRPLQCIAIAACVAGAVAICIQTS
jgi:drug/metabolite transporter (DMT)-like permease